MISRVTLENLQNRAEEFVSRNSQQRIGGILVRSPRLADGSVELITVGGRFFLSLEQISEVRRRFPDEIGGKQTDLPINPNRRPLSPEDFEDFCVAIEQQKTAQRPPIVVRNEV